STMSSRFSGRGLNRLLEGIFSARYALTNGVSTKTAPATAATSSRPNIISQIIVAPSAVWWSAGSHHTDGAYAVGTQRQNRSHAALFVPIGAGSRSRKREGERLPPGFWPVTRIL